MDKRLLLKLADEYGTPLYVYDAGVIRDRYTRFTKAFRKRYPRTKILYAYKANTNLAVCKLLKRLGAGADVVSGGELYIALKKVGLKPKDVFYTSNSKTQGELEFAVKSGVNLNMGNLEEADVIKDLGLRKKPRVSFRVNPAVNPKTHKKIATGLKQSKFGLHVQEGLALEGYSKALDYGFNVVGLHCHIGSQILEIKSFRDATMRMMEFACELKDKLNLKLEFIDLGGGLGIPYRGEKNVIGPEDLAKAVMPVFKDGVKNLGYRPALWMEPGRYLVGESGVMLTRINSVKKTPYKNFVNVDSGFNTLLRPAMYGGYHRIELLNQMEGKKKIRYDVAGNVCESGDILACNRQLPQVKRGDTIAFLDAGAYGYSMASEYNSHPLPAEVLVDVKKAKLIRKREIIKDLLRNQVN